MNFSIPAALSRKSATDDGGYECRKKKEPSTMASRTIMSTPPSTPQSNRYFKASPQRVQALRRQHSGESPKLARQHTMPILESSKSASTARIASNLRRAHSHTTASEAAAATKDLYSLGASSASEATTRKAHRPWQRQQPQCQIGRKPENDSDSNRRRSTKSATGWTHDTWLILSRYYEAVGRDAEETVNSFYRHESLQICKDTEGFYEIIELWPKDVVRWRVLCLSSVTKKHGGIPLLDRVKAYNEKKRCRRQRDAEEEKEGGQDQHAYEYEEDDDEEEHPACYKRVCRRQPTIAAACTK
ncbi:hypothetical protein BDB00DRAFT_840848 [Zychaea mexicana]|uniref:uncharacterized protein n=1 Tax=Zychaea mexicana TaxID=64656 RepID=UPI0022FF0C39|nr:uncharacterized protein BDB00DRAFT_840848 [Zychaea mexicana]KAI9489824.1 hypothetical protein BDB00DRAFT_840848 [Zychaea mexicana]